MSEPAELVLPSDWGSLEGLEQGSAGPERSDRGFLCLELGSPAEPFPPPTDRAGSELELESTGLDLSGPAAGTGG
ncbi:hypothetical protein THAOC_26265, partial [Thalassiosira oceanica]